MAFFTSLNYCPVKTPECVRHCAGHREHRNKQKWAIPNQSVSDRSAQNRSLYCVRKLTYIHIGFCCHMKLSVSVYKWVKMEKMTMNTSNTRIKSTAWERGSLLGVPTGQTAGSGGDLYDLYGLFFLFLDFTGFGKAFALVILTGNKRCRCKQTWRGRH